MGRRALRKPDPSFDLSAHLLPLDDLPEGVGQNAPFSRPAPLEIEVGTGKGLFLMTAAAEVPEHNYLGLEIAGKYARFAAARLAKRGLENAAIVHGDARRMFDEKVADGQLWAVHVYFPDPWWKKRHHKRRIMDESFLNCVARKLRPGGSLHFWTDVAEYYAATLQLIAEKINLKGPLSVTSSEPRDDMDYRTHFERRMRLHDEAVHRAEFRRPE